MPYRAIGPGDLVASRFRLEDLLDESSGACLWRATDLTLARNVAVHVIDAEDPRASAVLTAARTSATVSEPRILRVLDALEEGPLVHVVHEWGSGLSLDRMLADDVLEPRRAAWLVREVAESIAVAHRHGIAHGRLVPENVLLTEAGTIKLIGFVVDIVLHGRPLATGEGGRPPSEHESDVLDLGALLYACLTGRWPGYPPSLVPEAPVAEGLYLRARQVRPGVPRRLDSLCDRLIHAHRRPQDQRLESADAVVAALSEYLGDVPATVTLPVTDLATFLDPHATATIDVADGQAARDEAAGQETQAAAPSFAQDLNDSYDSEDSFDPADSGQPSDLSDPHATVASRPFDLPEPADPPGPTDPAGPADPPKPTDPAGSGVRDDTSDDTAEVADPGAGDRSPARAAPPTRGARTPAPPAARPPGPPRALPPPGPRPERPPGTGMGGAGAVPASWGPDRDEPPPPLSSTPPGASWLKLAGVIGLIGLVLLAIVIGVQLGRSGSEPAQPDGSGEAEAPGEGSGEEITIEAVRDFDPEQDGGTPEENPDLVGLATDGDPETAWETLVYEDGPPLAPYKSGVGLALDLGSATSVSEVEIRLGGGDHDVQLLAAEEGADPPENTEGLRSVATASGASGEVVLRPDEPVTTQYLVVWLTALPPADGGYRGAIAEITVRG